MKYAGRTDKGKTRTKNEDYFLLPEENKKIGLEKPDLTRGYLFVLCDGIGGHNAGDVALEKTAVWLMKDFYDEKIKNPDLEDIIKSVHTRIYNYSIHYVRYRNMGTTLVAALVKDDKLEICSVGDSRCYRLRDGELLQLTEDQSEVWQLYKEGKLTKDELRFHPFSNIITMSVGVQPEIEINRYLYNTKQNDIYLLCSDGLSDMLSDDEIKDILAYPVSLHKKANMLIKAANDAGGKDNITVVLVEI